MAVKINRQFGGRGGATGNIVMRVGGARLALKYVDGDEDDRDIIKSTT